LASRRLAHDVRAVAPQDDDELLYLKTADGVERPVEAAGDIPSAQRAVGAVPALAAGSWVDNARDKEWVAPTPAELEHSIDHFHPAANDSTWAEWHYFNVLSSDRNRWAFITFMVGARGALMLVTTHATGQPAERFTLTVPLSQVRTSTTRADINVG